MSNQTKTARIALFALTLWLAPVFAPSAFAYTRVLGFWKLRQNQQIEIEVNLYATPFAGALVEVYRYSGSFGQQPKTKPLMVLTSNEDGHVVLPMLPRGKYYILGRAKPDREDDLYLEISPFGRKWPHPLILYLNPTPGSAEDMLAYISNKKVDLVSTFHGVVKDLDGTPLPNADIDVFVKRLGADQRATHLQTSSAGEFSADFPEGQYVLHIWKDMWESIVLVDVSKAATSETLEIRLRSPRNAY